MVSIAGQNDLQDQLEHVGPALVLQALKMKGSVGFLGASVTVMRSRFGMYRAKKLYGFWRMEFRIHGVCPESEPSTLNREDFGRKR